MLKKLQALDSAITQAELEKALAELGKSESQLLDGELAALVKRIQRGRNQLTRPQGFGVAKSVPAVALQSSDTPEIEIKAEAEAGDDLTALQKAIAAKKREIEALTLKQELLQLEQEVLQAQQAVSAQTSKLEISAKASAELMSLAAESGRSMAEDAIDRTRTALEKTLELGKQTPVEAEISLARAALTHASQRNRLQAILNGTPALLEAAESQVPATTTIDI